MEPRPIPQKYLDQGVGIPMSFAAPEGLEDEIGSLDILVIAHPEQMRAMLLGMEPPFEPGSKDFWISWWQPSQEEVKKIVQGAPIRLTFVGATVINPMQIGVGVNLPHEIEQGDDRN